MTTEPEEQQSLDPARRAGRSPRRRAVTMALGVILAAAAIGSVAFAVPRLAGTKRIVVAAPEAGSEPRSDPIAVPVTPSPSESPVPEPSPSPAVSPARARRPSRSPLPTMATGTPMPPPPPAPAPQPSVTPSPSPEGSPTPMPSAAPDHQVWRLGVQWIDRPTWEWDPDLFPAQGGGYRLSAGFRVIADDGSALSFPDWSRQLIIYGQSGSRRLVAAFTHRLVGGTPSEGLYDYNTAFPASLHDAAGRTFVVDQVCIAEEPSYDHACRPAGGEEIVSWTIPAP